MAELLVSDLDEELVRALHVRAATHGRSAEAEHRAILEAALMPARDFKAFLLSMPNVGEDADFDRDRFSGAFPRDGDL